PAPADEPGAEQLDAVVDPRRGQDALVPADVVQHAAHVVGQRLVVAVVVRGIAALREAAELGGQPADPHAELVGGAQVDVRGGGGGEGEDGGDGERGGQLHVFTTNAIRTVTWTSPTSGACSVRTSANAAVMQALIAGVGPVVRTSWARRVSPIVNRAITVW